MKDESPFSSKWRESQYGDENIGCFTSFVPGYCGHPIARWAHDSLEKYFGAPIYDEYEDDYWDGMPKETVWEPVSPGLNRERDEVSKNETSPDDLNLMALYQGKVFFLPEPVEGDDCTLAKANPKNEVLDFKDRIQDDDALF